MPEQQHLSDVFPTTIRSEKPIQICLWKDHETSLTDFIGIFSQLVLHEKIFGVKDLQTGSSTSKDQTIFVRHCEEAGALFWKIIRSIEDADLLQRSELKILLWESWEAAVHVLTQRMVYFSFSRQQVAKFLHKKYKTPAKAGSPPTGDKAEI